MIKNVFFIFKLYHFRDSCYTLIMKKTFSVSFAPTVAMLCTLATLGSLLIPSFAFASVIRTDSNIAQNENIAENVYLTSANPVVAGTVQGDLMAMGSSIFVTGAVVQDATLMAGNVNVTGRVGGDLRVFGGNMTIDGAVDGELLVFGGTVIVGPHAVIQGDVNITAGNVQVDPAAKMVSIKINIQSGDKNKLKAPRTLMMDTNQFLSTAFWITQLMLLAGILLVVFIFHFVYKNFTKKFVQIAATGGSFWKSFLKIGRAHV